MSEQLIFILGLGIGIGIGGFLGIVFMSLMAMANRMEITEELIEELRALLEEENERAN